jgi:hypothetical protein
MRPSPFAGAAGRFAADSPTRVPSRWCIASARFGVHGDAGIRLVALTLGLVDAAPPSGATEESDAAAGEHAFVLMGVDAERLLLDADAADLADLVGRRLSTQAQRNTIGAPAFRLYLDRAA